MIGLVNLCKPGDYSKTETYLDDIQFLIDNNISFIDTMKGISSHDDKLQAFHDAIKNPNIDIIWFVSGGIELITYLHEIDWDLVKDTKKRYVGLSDFTHFAMIATQLGIECYYGLGLQKIHKYYPKDADKKRLVDFLTKYEPVYKRELPIVGGHMLITSLLLADRKYDITNAILFIEHHYIPGETLYNLDYWVDTLLYVIEYNRPKEIILGKTFLFNQDGSLMDIDMINKHIEEKMTYLGIPISYVDHTRHVIKMG